MIHFEMKSLDQIATIADLCDFLDRAARIDAAASSFLPYYYTLKLRDFWVRKGDADRCSCGVKEDEEHYGSTDELLPRLFDLDAFGWQFEGVSFRRREDVYYWKTTYYEITLRREV